MVIATVNSSDIRIHYTLFGRIAYDRMIAKKWPYKVAKSTFKVIVTVDDANAALRGNIFGEVNKN